MRKHYIILARKNLLAWKCGIPRKHSRRMLKKARRLTRPTLAATSPARPESAKTCSSPRDAPCPQQCRIEGGRLSSSSQADVQAIEVLLCRNGFSAAC